MKLRAQEMEELQISAKPLVEFLRKYHDPHAVAIVEDDRVRVFSGDMSVPFQYEDSDTQHGFPCNRVVSSVEEEIRVEEPEYARGTSYNYDT